MRAVTSTTDPAGPSETSRPGQSWSMKGGSITFAVMVLVLIVALLFAANQNDVIGWLLVVIAAGWLVLAVLVVLGVRRGARSVSRQVKNMTATMAPRATEVSGTTYAQSQGDPMRDTKLDHSFKIVQVQTRVVTQELAKGEGADTEMVARALETIEITSANARDMIKESTPQDSGSAAGAGSTQARPDEDGPLTGEVIN